MGKLALYSYPGNARAFKALVAAKFNGVEIEMPPFQMGVDNKKPDFLKLNPMGKVPTLQTPEGGLFESTTIARYVAKLKPESGLMGSGAYEEALVDAWLEFSMTEIDNAIGSWLYTAFGFYPYDEAAVKKAQGAINRTLAVLDSYLLEHTYLVGDRITMADVGVVCSLSNPFRMLLDRSYQNKYPNVVRYFNTVAHHPNFVAVLGEPELCRTTADLSGAKGASEEAAAAKKEEPAAAEKKGEKKHWSQDLPKTNFNLEEWKRVYMNDDTRPKALPWLWENLDKEGFSVYFCDYKYSSENQKVFMSANLIGGFFQRLDRLRKYSMGTVVIFGQDDNNSINGMFMFRGQDVPPEMRECDDSELYTWNKADLDNEDHRKLVEDFLAWDGEFKPVFPSQKFFGGFNQGKVFR